MLQHDAALIVRRLMQLARRLAEGSLATADRIAGATLRSVTPRLMVARRHAESGQSVVEYALLAALIGIALIVVVQAFTSGVAGVFNRMLESLSAVGS